MLAHTMRLRYYLEESYENLRQNKLRSLLTGFGVAWGIFLLVLLVGAGESLYNGIRRDFSKYAQNTVRVYGGERTPGDYISFTLPLLHNLQANVAGIEHVAPVVYSSNKVQYTGREYAANIKGVGIRYDQVMQLALDQGRAFNELDEASIRPVCILGYEVRDKLFAHEEPIGKFINIGGYYFQVVGTLDKENNFNEREREVILIPVQTFQKTFNWGTNVSQFCLSLRPGASGEAVENGMRAYLASQLHFDKADRKILWVWNVDETVKQFNALFNTIRLFLWLVGLAMLLSGVVGVSNMMFVLVKERTQEIGIRKVIGASAREILMMIMTEAIFISLVAGTLGMLAGIGGVYLLNQLLDYVDPMQQSPLGHLVFKAPAAIAALLLLVLAGAIAGLVPARRATAIRPIKALNSE